jgi:hypothetical protein
VSASIVALCGAASVVIKGWQTIESVNKAPEEVAALLCEVGSQRQKGEPCIWTQNLDI